MELGAGSTGGWEAGRAEDEIEAVDVNIEEVERVVV
jgi:hypothetical protein